MPPRLAQEELQRVGRRLGRRCGRRGWGSRLLLFLGLLGDELDPPAVELHVHRLELQDVELERLEQLLQLGLADLSAHLAGLEQHHDLLGREDRFDLDRAQIPLPDPRVLGNRSSAPP